MREEPFDVEVHSVSSRGAQAGNSLLLEQGGEEGGLAQPVREVSEIRRLLETDGHRFEVSPREAPVRREPLEHDQFLLEPLGELGVPSRDETPDVDEAILLRAHRCALAEAEELPSDLP